LIAPEEGHRREGLPFAEDVPGDRLALFGGIHPMFQAHVPLEERMVPVGHISGGIDVRVGFTEGVADNAVLQRQTTAREPNLLFPLLVCSLLAGRI